MKPIPRTAREAFPRATRESLYTFVEKDPERRLVGPAMVAVTLALAALILIGVIQL